MTKLGRKVKRAVDGGRRGGYVVTLEQTAAGGMLSVREKGQRASSAHAIGIPALHTLLAMRAADNRRAARRGRRLPLVKS